jgi:saccharopine dehydrogenase-like NADP-dependent oxidoreductase
MKRVLIVGAGAQGGPCAAILAREDSVTEIRLGDINIEMARQVANRIGSSKVRPIKLDASQKDELVMAAEGVDLIFNFTLIEFNEILMEAALASQAHYVDTACNLDFLNHWITGEQPKYHHDYRGIGKTALVGCGFSPGIANVLTRYACDRMERVESIIIRVGRSYGANSDEVVSEWKPTWSPETLLEDYSDPPMVLKEGEFREVPIFSNPETYTFPEPVGEVLISSHNHEEPYLIPRYYQDKGLQEVDFKYPVDALAGAFVKMGFADDEPIDVNGMRVVPRDVLMRLVKRPGNSFLQENEETILQSELTGIMDICIAGERDGEKVTHTISYTFADGTDKHRQQRLYQAYGTTQLYVALPALIGAKMCFNGEVASGVITPDALEPEKFLRGMAERGVPFLFQEKIIKQKIFH